MGHHTTSQDKRRKVIERDNFYYIPILSTLKQILQIESVRNELFRTVHDDMHYLHDFCDGEAFRNHTFFSLQPHALQITLGNIRPSFRSSLRSIFLVAVARSSTIKVHGIDVLLKPFVDDLSVA